MKVVNQVRKVVLTLAMFAVVNVIAVLVAPKANAADPCPPQTPCAGVNGCAYCVAPDPGGGCEYRQSGGTTVIEPEMENCDGDCTSHIVNWNVEYRTCETWCDQGGMRHMTQSDQQCYIKWM